MKQLFEKIIELDEGNLSFADYMIRNIGEFKSKKA